MTRRKLVLLILLAVAPVLLVAQQPGGDQTVGSSGARGLGSSGLDPASILKPLGDSWLTYSGDYTGRRYSSLTQINQTSVKNLGLAWVSRGFVQGSGPGPGARGRLWRRPRWRRWRRAADSCRRSNRRVQQRRPGANPRVDPHGRRHLVSDLARQPLGRRRARRDDLVALLLENARGDAHRASRRRYVAQLPVHGDARQLSGED